MQPGMSELVAEDLLAEEDIQRKLEAIKLLEQRKRLAEGLPFLYGWPWYKWAKEFFDSTSKMCFITAANQVSKAVHINTLIPTPKGFKTMGELKVNDFVFGRDGKETKIVAIPYLGSDDEYKITFSDGSEVTCSPKHIWVCKGYKERFRKGYQSRWKGKVTSTLKNKTYGDWVEKSLEQIIQDGGYSPETIGTKRHVIPVCDPVSYSKKDLFDPYYLGAYIGNGGGRSLTFNESDIDIAKVCLKYGNKINCKTGKLIISAIGDYYLRLEALGLVVPSHQKFIPGEYLFGSIKQRKDLLAGLMDTDGTCDKRGSNYNYCTTSEVLAHQVLELVTSLGGIGQIKKYPSYYYKEDGTKKECRDHYVITIWTTFNPFRSKRKAALWKPNSRYKHERVILKIEKLKPAPMKCITVDNEDGTFLATKNYIVTHNSSTQIRKIIDWATNVDKWPSLWRHRPTQFWYLYPTGSVATIEFETKWSQFLPAGEFKEHPIYGWKSTYKNREIWSIRFNSGVTIYFKTYSQDVMALQAGSVDYVATDEEVPTEVYDELIFRISATAGYFSMVFTATLGQDFWRQVMEPTNRETALLPEASKWQVSMYECLTYQDGSPAPWTLERIKEIERRCKNEAEVQRRVYGKFILDSGRKYPTFNSQLHLTEGHPLPSDWIIYAGVDIGTGGVNHKAAIAFVAVNPEMSQGRVVFSWRGDEKETTAGDVLEKFVSIKRERGYRPVAQYYDWASRDFFSIATRMGEAFIRAEKSHDLGEDVLNSLFGNDALIIYNVGHGSQMANEFIGLTQRVKNKAKDDLVDAVRYACSLIPWNWNKIVKNYVPRLQKQDEFVADNEITRRRKQFDEGHNKEKLRIEQEFNEWNDLYG